MSRVMETMANGRREEIVAAASRLFLSNGYEKTTMRQVMEQVQGAKGLMYRHFRSKEDLLDAVVEYLAEHSTRHLQTVLARTRGNGLERLRQLVEGIVSNNTMHHYQPTEETGQPDNAVMHLRLNARIVTAHAPFFAELIRQGSGEGLFRTDHPLECAEFILAAVQFLSDVAFFPWSSDQLARRVASFPALIESLLQAPTGSFQFMLEMVSVGSPGVFMPPLDQR